jgi:hypothetical protein
VKAQSHNSSITESPHTNRRENADVIASTLDESQRRRKEFRDDCLERDGYRCVYSKDMDIENWTKLGMPDDINQGHLEAAHIIPFAYGSWSPSVINPLFTI